MNWYVIIVCNCGMSWIHYSGVVSHFWNVMLLGGAVLWLATCAKHRPQNHLCGTSWWLVPYIISFLSHSNMCPTLLNTIFSTCFKVGVCVCVCACVRAYIIVRWHVCTRVCLQKRHTEDVCRARFLISHALGDYVSSSMFRKHVNRGITC